MTQFSRNPLCLPFPSDGFPRARALRYLCVIVIDGRLADIDVAPDKASQRFIRSRWESDRLHPAREAYIVFIYLFTYLH